MNKTYIVRAKDTKFIVGIYSCKFEELFDLIDGTLDPHHCEFNVRDGGFGVLLKMVALDSKGANREVGTEEYKNPDIYQEETDYPQISAELTEDTYQLFESDNYWFPVSEANLPVPSY